MYEKIHLLDPMDYPDFIYLMSECCLVLSDSGGIQEEAPSFDKKVVLLRDTTERPEGVSAGFVYLSGADETSIISTTLKLLSELRDATSQMNNNMQNPFGDGNAATRIVADYKLNMLNRYE